MSEISTGQFLHCDCQTPGCMCAEQFFLNAGKKIPTHPTCTGCMAGRHVMVAE